ncbi:MAG TPA: hypothetical protein VFJ30_10450 [Phycisphaerae bacterium]|nr:hypothetical protein [Phycisphaerae bacterium]
MVLRAAKEEAGRVRVVALVYPSTRVEEVRPRAEWVRAAGAYQAAAEMLAEPAAALVVDLGRITAGHAGLLSLAGRLGVPVIAFGEVSADLGADALGSARLITREGLPEALDRILPPELPEPAESTSPEDQAGAAARAEAAEEAPPAAEAAAEPEAPRTPGRPAEMLTQAELDALLG